VSNPAYLQGALVQYGLEAITESGLKMRRRNNMMIDYLILQRLVCSELSVEQRH